MASSDRISRFSRLEIESEALTQARPEEALKGESHYFEEAETFFRQGDYESALRFYAKVLEHNPSRAAAWSGQVRMLIELGEFTEARLWADKALERFPKDPELLAAKAVALSRLGDLRAALAYSDASFEEKGDTAYVWLARGDIMLARKERRADACFERARLLSRKDWFVEWLISRVYFYYRHFAAALASVQSVLCTEAGLAQIWIHVGLCQQELGMTAVALASYQRACEIEPHQEKARVLYRSLKEAGWWNTLRARWCRWTTR